MDTSDDPERCIVVCGLPTNVPAGTLKDKLSIHFQSRRKSGGGDVSNVELTDDGQMAYVWFEAPETAQNVLQQKEQVFEITVAGENREVPLKVEARRAPATKPDQAENADEDVAKETTAEDDTSEDKKPTETSEETKTEGQATEGPDSERNDSLDDFVVLEREGIEDFDQTECQPTVGSPEKYLTTETERKLLLQDVQRELGIEKPSIVPSVNLYEGNTPSSSVKSKTGPESEKPLNNAVMTGSYISHPIVQYQEEVLLKVHRNVMNPPDGATPEEEPETEQQDEREEDDSQEADSIEPAETTETGADGKDCTILVMGVKETTDDDTLRDFFESKRISDGAEVKSLDRKDGVVTVTFTDAAAVTAVLKNRPLQLEGAELGVSVPAAERPREPAPIDQRRVFLTGLPQGTDAETVSMYMEARSRSDIQSVEFGLEPGTVLVTFEEVMQDMETVIRKCQGKPLHGATLSAVPVFMTDWIVVTNLPEQATTHEDTVFLYFESKRRSGGGDVSDVKLLPEEKMAYVQFEDYQCVSNVVKREHKLHQTPIQVRPFHPCLGMKTATVKPKPIKLPSPVVVQVDPTVMEYMTSDVDSMLSVKSSLRCVSASLVWPHNDDRRLAALAPSFAEDEAARAIDEHDWCQEALNTFNKILVSFSSESVQVPATVWDNVSAGLAYICNRADPDKKVVIKVSPTDQAVTLTGPKMYVSQVVKAIRDSISKEEEEYAKATAVVLGPPIEMKPLELQHLMETGYIEAMTKKHRVEADTAGRLVFKGVSTAISAATVEVYEKLRKLSTNQMSVSAAEGFLRFITRDPWRSYIKQCIKEQRIQAHWAVQGGMLVVVAESEDEYLKAVDRFRSTVTETEMPVHGPALKVLDSDKWTSFLSTIQDSFSGLLQIAVNSDKDGKLVLITGPSENVNMAKEQIDQFLKNNTVLESFVEMPVGVLEFLQKMKKEVIGKLQERLQKGEGYITATTDGDVAGFTVVGTQDGIQQTVKHLQQLQNNVTHQELSIQNPGMKKYFSAGQPGEEKLKSIGDVFNCIIKTHKEKKADDIHCEPLNHVLLPRSRKLVVFKDDLTKHHVDAITNAANKNLKNTGGLAEAIIKAGGKGIQDHCDQIMKEEPAGLTGGAVRVTGPGKLPCKAVLHAVGPNFHEIKDDKRSRDELFKTVTNVLAMASRYGFSSVAIPAISSGIFGGPLDLCTKTVVRATGLYFKKNKDSAVNEVHFVGIDMDIAQSFNKALLETFDEYGGWNPDSESRENSLECVVLPPEARGPPPCPPEYGEHLVTPGSYSMFTNQGLKITLARGSISDQQADVIVNTIGPDLNLRTGAVSKALLDAAGPKLQVECDKIKKDLGRLPAHGEVVQTSGGNLGCKHVYHAVCSFWNPQDSAKSEDVLRKIVAACLKGADKDSMRTIAFPALGTGGLGYPKDVVARLMFEETLSHSSKNPAGDLEEAKFVIYDQPSFEAFLSELGKHTEIGAGAATSLEPTAHVTAPEREDPVAVQMTPDGSFKTKVTMRDVVVEVEQGDITREKVDAIVNPTRGDMDLSLGKVSQVLKRKGGPVVQTECEKYDKDKLKKDGVGITAAGGLASRYILHLVAPGFETEKWKKAIINCLAFAESHQLKSLAFPALGTGQMAKDPTESATMIIEAIAEFAQKKNPKHLKCVRIVIFEAGMIKPFHDKLGKCLKTSSSLSLKNFVSGVKKLVNKIRPEPAKPPPPKPPRPVVLLDIYAGSKEDVESAVSKIQETANRESKTHHVTDKLIARLTDEDNAIILQKALERDVDMEICNGRKKIRLQGLAEDILVLQSEIHQILARVMNEGKQREHAQLIAAVIKWVYVDNGTEVEFDRLTNLKIENALNEGHTRVRVDVDDVGECIAHLQPNAFKLVTVDGGHRYKLKRKAAGEPEFPSTWTSVKSDFDMVSVEANSPEYEGIVKAFMRSAGGNGIEIQSVKRVQSRLCYTQYMTTKREKETSGQISNVNLERRLYHGTSAETCDKIARHGFNRAFCSSENLFGSGVYFAGSAFYALQDSYSRPDDRGYKHVFVAKVLTGDYCKGDPSFKAAPSKTEDGSLLYDSVVDDEDNPNIFVVFHDTVAYPEYLITFKEKSDTPAEWTRMRYDTALAIEPVDRTSEEYQRVSQMFTVTNTGNRTIVKIERIQSRFLWTQYQQRKQVLSAIFPPDMQFERQLFHGVSGNMCEDISIQGFNSHNAGNYDPDYGVGVYFTVNSADSAHDRHAPADNTTGERHMYLARVLTGGYCQGAPGLTHPGPWDLPADGTGDDVYLSAVDNTENPKIFVIFDVVAEVQAYPEYLITFK